MPRTDLALALCLAALTAASRIPFRSRLLPTWDAIQFALALREYDVVKHQPHPPGYILYVALGRALNVLAADPAATLTWLAVAASAVTVFLAYRLAWTLYGRATAVLAALGLAASPLFWFYGLVGLPYTAEAALATLVAATVWRLRHGRPADVAWSAIVLGLAGGIRQSVLLLLFPLWAGAVHVAFRRWRPLLAGVGVLALTVAAWLVPMIWLTGGGAAYLAAALELFDSTVRRTTVLADWHGNVLSVVESLLLGVGVLGLVLLPAGAAGLRHLARGEGRAWLFAGWILPPLLVYTFVHFGQYGYLCTVLPALYIVIARAVVRVAATRGPAGPPWRARGRWAAAAGAFAMVLTAHVAFFTRAESIEVPGLEAEPGSERRETWLLAGYRFRLWPHTVRGLREQEEVIRAYARAVRDSFPPGDTVLVTELGNRRSFPWFRHAMYYLPEYPVYHLRLGIFTRGYLASHRDTTMAALADPDVILPATARRLVWMVDYWNPAIPRPAGLRAIPVDYGRWLYVLELERRVVEHGGYRLTPVTALARLR
jgi:hypothetical protein